MTIMPWVIRRCRFNVLSEYMEWLVWKILWAYLDVFVFAYELIWRRLHDTMDALMTSLSSCNHIYAVRVTFFDM